MTKPTKWVCAQRRLGSAWASAESLVSAWRNFGSLATHWVHSEDSDQTGRMPKLIWVFARRTLILLAWSCRSSNHNVVTDGMTTLHASNQVICNVWSWHDIMPLNNSDIIWEAGLIKTFLLCKQFTFIPDCFSVVHFYNAWL